MSSESGDEGDVLRRKMLLFVAIGEKDGSRLLVATEWAN
jgi:hypothetical protein